MEVSEGEEKEEEITVEEMAKNKSNLIKSINLYNELGAPTRIKSKRSRDNIIKLTKVKYSCLETPMNSMKMQNMT